MYVFNAAWLALAVVLSVVFAAAAVVALRTRGLRPAIFLAGLTMLPIAGYLTGTLRLVGIIVDQLTGYVVGFAFSPKVWLGVILAAAGVLLMATASAMKRRGIAAPAGRRGKITAAESGVRRETLPHRGKSPTGVPGGARDSGGAGGAGGAGDSTDPDGMDDIEEILRRHGIS